MNDSDLELWLRSANDTLCQPIVLLQMVFRLNGEQHADNYSGFLCWHKRCKQLYWISAEHIFDERVRAVIKSGAEIESWTWIDNDIEDQIGHTRFEANIFQNTRLVPNEYDLCILPLSKHDTNLLAANQNNKSIEFHEIAKANDDFDFYVLSGCPAETTKYKEKHVHGRHSLLGCEICKLSIPIDRLSYEEALAESECDSFKGHQGWFFGKLGCVYKNDNIPLGTIEGMSGGLIYGVRKKDDKYHEVRVVAVQSSWHAPSRIIRAVPISFLSDDFDEAVERPNN